MADVPTTQYAKTTDGVHIAYQAFGSGPPDLVVVPGFISHVEMWWEFPAFAMVFRRLASLARVILFDKRGTGMSDPTAELPDIDRRMLDVLGVLDAVGSDRASILGISEGGASSQRRADRRPHAVDQFEKLTACAGAQRAATAM